MKIVIHQRPVTAGGQAARTIPLQPDSITLSLQLGTSLRHLEAHITQLPEPYSCCMLFFTVTAPGQDACVFIVRRDTLEAAWREGATRVRQWAWVRRLSAVDLRIDWPHEITAIESRTPLPCQSDSASAWALADEDLEYAELLPPMELSSIHQTALHARLKTGLSTGRAAAATSTHLLLRLQGLHVDHQGVPTALPKAPLPQRAPAQDPWRPFIPAVQMLCQQQQREGNWPNVVGVDHLGMVYALLLAQCHVAASTPAHALLVQAIDRAMAYPGDSTASGLRSTDAAHIEQAMRLLVLTRYVSIRRDGHALTGLLGPMARLAENLTALERSASLHAWPWASLALDAFAQCQSHGETGPSPECKTRPADALASEPMLETFLQLPPVHRHSDGDGFDNQRWQAIAMAEISLLNPGQSALRDKHYFRWALAHRHCRQVNGSSGPGWPSFGPFAREQALLVSLVPGGNLVSDCSAAALLLLTAFSTYKRLNP